MAAKNGDIEATITVERNPYVTRLFSVEFTAVLNPDCTCCTLGQGETFEEALAEALEVAAAGLRNSVKKRKRRTKG